MATLNVRRVNALLESVKTELGEAGFADPDYLARGHLLRRIAAAGNGVKKTSQGYEVKVDDAAKLKAFYQSFGLDPDDATRPPRRMPDGGVVISLPLAFATAEGKALRARMTEGHDPNGDAATLSHSLWAVGAVAKKGEYPPEVRSLAQRVAADLTKLHRAISGIAGKR